jgi:4-amino-4-deoxy-L-arabinose transferase-like glycosyltransferase
VLAALLRVWGLGTRDLWLDEAFSVLYARLDWSAVIDLRRAGTNPPLYHFLLCGWVEVFGSSEAAVRAPSVICGVLSVWAVYRLGRRLWDRPTGLWAAGLLGVSNMAVAYSQEARFYALIELVAILSTWAAYAWVRTPRRRTGLAYTASAVVFVWLHTFAWPVLAAHLAWLLIRAGRNTSRAERKRLLRGAVTAGGVVIVSFLPWVAVLADQVRSVLAGYWIPRPRLVEPLVCLYDHLAPLRWPITRYAVAAVAVLVTAITLAGRTRLGRNRAWRSDTGDQPLALLLLWLVIPIAIPFAWSCLATPVFQIKYTIVAQPAAILLLARLAVRVPIPAMIILAAVSLRPPTSPDYPLVVEDWRKAAGIIREWGPPDAPVYMYRDYCTFALAYSLGDDTRIIPVLARDQRRSDFEGYTSRPAVPFDAMLERLRQRSGPAWLVLARVRGYGEGHYDQVCRNVEEVRPIADKWRLAEVDVLRLASVDPVPAAEGANP